jgi:predicted branched-subunit amino acid permease
VANGFTVLQSCLLSLLTFSGASQFAVIGVLGAGGSALSGIATASLLGVRNALYGVIMAPHLKVSGLTRIVAAQITIDESTAVALGQESRGIDAMRKGFWYTGIGVFVFWNLFTLAGALGAQAMGDVRAFGLDSAVPAAFLGLVWPRLTGKFERVLAVSCAIFAIAMTPILPAGLPIIATAFIAIAVGLKR